MSVKTTWVAETDPFTWNLGSWYVVNFYCEQADISRSPIYYTTTTTMPPSNQGANRFRLNEYLDVEVQVWVAGGYKQYVQAPFTNVSNRNSNNTCKKRKGYTRATNVESGSKGKVTFIVTKPIINGINITSQSLVEVAGRMGERGTYAHYGDFPCGD
ncbi:fimbrial adhesin [Citrobacter braakii]|nr:fimbrial adhesin [Citrobacter braakii]